MRLEDRRSGLTGFRRVTGAGRRWSRRRRVRVRMNRSRLGAWEGGRWLNGDQTHQGRHVNFPRGTWSQQRVKIYRYR
jgi:hypothetical protein